ncbi:uncharacterized protein LOC131046041 isoform X1 [Cryptomeria japonica]|uniref:uncharacterized protein LOC131046041 isoform X1 n=1 Tax=Cryptomeria japonica TaxID=3369 RepID=UPI0027DA420B|nr:uncharacterized protein LOC131046041 isoform X1 [Cryptomeria japonica]XP_057835684.2 uncharacterized protein LOC131046041 isoform X1 [Cryptomeria japonica]XP_059074075.1 uncharacterized protein LOC131046041 isoform X1 [Cryptomeria japonica]XP_059074076.1 uncharacterized protein LOC131046041 isoform X1 [Cryptomeria japonica]
MAQLQSFSMFSSTKLSLSSPVKAGGRHTQDLKFLHFNASAGCTDFEKRSCCHAFAVASSRNHIDRATQLTKQGYAFAVASSRNHIDRATQLTKQGYAFAVASSRNHIDRATQLTKQGYAFMRNPSCNRPYGITQLPLHHHTITLILSHIRFESFCYDKLFLYSFCSLICLILHEIEEILKQIIFIACFLFNSLWHVRYNSRFQVPEEQRNKEGKPEAIGEFSKYKRRYKIGKTN